MGVVKLGGAMSEARVREFEVMRETVKSFEVLLGSSKDGILVTNDAANIMVADQGFSSILGCCPADIVDTSILECLSIFTGDPVSHWLELQREVHDNGVCKNMEFQLAADVNPRFFSVNASCLDLGPGKDSRIVVSIWRDVTSRKKDETPLRQAGNRDGQLAGGQGEQLWTGRGDSADLLKSMVDGVCVINRQLEIQFVNQALEREFGAWDCRRCYEYFFDRQEQCPWCQNEEVFAGEISHRLWYSKKTGKTYDLIGSPMVGRDGAVFKLEMFRDITEHQRAESTHRQVLKSESLNTMAGAIAHNFNNILMALIGNLELARFDLPHDSPITENIKNCRKAAQRANDLSNLMLTYVGQKRTVLEVVDLATLVREPIALLQTTMGSGKKLEFHAGPAPLFFRGDPAQVHQILLSLVSNADEAVGAAGGVVSVTVGRRFCQPEDFPAVFRDDNHRPGNYVYFEVSDTGHGMGEDALEKIFDPFFSTRFTGRGLGMAVVMGIVRAHQGVVAIESEVGRGTSVKVFFSELEGVGEGMGEKKKKERNVLPPVLAGTVILADDEQMILDVAKPLLEHLGLKVLTARDGFEVLKLYEGCKEEISCIILDISMPGLDGIETFRELERTGSDVRVVIVSGFSAEQAARQISPLRAAGYLEKPFHLSDLREMMEKVLD